MILTEKQNQLQQTGFNSYNIQTELDTLRESFAQLKVEKEAMINEMERTKQSEVQWRHTVDQLKRDIDGLQRKISIEQEEQNYRVVNLAAQDESLIVELKLLRNENLTIKQNNQALFDKLAATEQMVEDEGQRLRMNQIQLKEANKAQVDLKNLLAQSEHKLSGMQHELKISELNRHRALEDFTTKIEEIKESQQSLADLYENQLKIIQQKYLDLQLQLQAHKEPKSGQVTKEKIEKEVDLAFSLSQREAFIKQLKKELQTLKAQVAKYKSKNTELKK